MSLIPTKVGAGLVSDGCHRNGNGETRPYKRTRNLPSSAIRVKMKKSAIALSDKSSS
ncbi:MAG: hypothetical protein RIB93_00665 [Coleofasciculus sp. D1-CHI-01]|uniref:hypothetical protein n=1 Tax=Coleofasciculus sp. D1-CHI-01 TaxID=3068482 RepID=UPI0032FCA232